MKFIKRFFSMLLAVTVFVGISAITVFAEADETRQPIYASGLNSGTYDIKVTSSSSMFKIVKCELTVSDSDMTAVMTLSGKGYEKLYMGKGEQAIEASDGDYIYYVEDADGKYTYTVPVEALDTGIDCTAFSFKKKQWYDRVIVFESDSLPEGAFINDTNQLSTTGRMADLSPFYIVLIVCAAVAAIVVTIVVVAIFARNTGKRIK